MWAYITIVAAIVFTTNQIINSLLITWQLHVLIVAMLSKWFDRQPTTTLFVP